MEDTNGITIREGDRVRVQTAPDGPVAFGRVEQATTHRARELKAVLVRFENGTGQFMSNGLTVVGEE